VASCKALLMGNIPIFKEIKIFFGSVTDFAGLNLTKLLCGTDYN